MFNAPRGRDLQLTRAESQAACGSIGKNMKADGPFPPRNSPRPPHFTSDHTLAFANAGTSTLASGLASLRGMKKRSAIRLVNCPLRGAMERRYCAWKPAGRLASACPTDQRCHAAGGSSCGREGSKRQQAMSVHRCFCLLFDRNQMRD